MGLFKTIVNILSAKNQIEYSKITNMVTRYGIFQIKAYKDNEIEFLAIMSRNFFTLDTPIVYLHTQMHHHGLANEAQRINHNQIDSGLKTIYKNGGVVIFFSNDGRDIDELLLNIGAKKFKNEANQMHKETIEIGLKGLSSFYNSLGFILQDLALSSISLVSNNQKAIELIEALDIKIVKKTEAIFFEYGTK